MNIVKYSTQTPPWVEWMEVDNVNIEMMQTNEIHDVLIKYIDYVWRRKENQHDVLDVELNHFVEKFDRFNFCVNREQDPMAALHECAKKAKENNVDRKQLVPIIHELSEFFVDNVMYVNNPYRDYETLEAAITYL